MKITQDKEGFKPITIRLDTLKEAKVLKTIMGKISGSGEVRKITDNLYTELERLEITCYGNVISHQMVLESIYSLYDHSGE